MNRKRNFFGSHRILLALLLFSSILRAETNNDYQGVKDPFGDPTNYEFQEDEAEDKEFFHLGRYLMIGTDLGAGIFTGGLGISAAPTIYFGIHLIYFLDTALAFEIAGHYGNHLDQVRTASGTGLDQSVDIIPIQAGFRYYFDTKAAPKAFAVANPYLNIGGGAIMRNTTVLNNTTGATVSPTNSSSFSAYAGAGVQFDIYRKSVYLGVDLRYHLVIFPDEDSTLGGIVPAGERSGDYLTSVIALTYNF